MEYRPSTRRVRRRAAPPAFPLLLHPLPLGLAAFALSFFVLLLRGCQSYRSPEQLAEKWGTDAEYYSGRIREAVYGTAGEVATYDGELIEALYHSTSGGVTENSENVFASAEPYLVSVASPGEEGTAHYAETTTFSSKSFATKLNAAFPKAGLSEKKLEEQVRIISRYASGRV